MQIFVLGTEELKEQHSGLNLKKVVLDLLAKYGIYPKNLYSITSDNGSNIIKMVELIDLHYQILKYGNLPEIDPNEEETINELVDVISVVTIGLMMA